MSNDTDAQAGALKGRLLSERTLAARYDRTVRTLQRWRARGYGPACMRIGGSIFYRLEDVEAFEARMRKGGEDM